jgi:hypothetical protein
MAKLAVVTVWLQPSTTIVLTPSSQRHIGLTLKRLHIHHVEQCTLEVAAGVRQLPECSLLCMSRGVVG